MITTFCNNIIKRNVIKRKYSPKNKLAIKPTITQINQPIAAYHMYDILYSGNTYLNYKNKNVLKI